MNSDELTHEAAPAVRLHPDFRPTAILLRTDKSTLVTGHSHGTPVIAKILTSTQALWKTQFTHEVETYRALLRTPHQSTHRASSPRTTPSSSPSGSQATTPSPTENATHTTRSAPPTWKPSSRL